MKPATLIFADTGEAVSDSVAGYLLGDTQRQDRLTWKPSASCQLERDALADLFSALMVMQRRREAVHLAVDHTLHHYQILEVDEARQVLSLRGYSKKPSN